MESSDPKYSYATLRDEETGGAGPFWPGDNLRPTAVLVSVERSMVHLRNGGALEYIELGVEPPKGAAKPVAAPTKKKPDEDAPKPAGAIEGAENAIKCESENSCTIERAWLEGVLSNPASLAKQARVMPSVKDGETRGFKFYGIRPGSLPKLLNIKNGDLITAVNGTELKSMDGAMSLYAKLRRANNLSVTIERKGESITKEITIQ
jgi:general secretion pathway protein C